MEETTKRRNTFLLAMRHDFIENRKGLLLGLGVVWGIYFLFGALLGYNGRGAGDLELVACIFFAVAFSCIGASLAFLLNLYFICESLVPIPVCILLCFAYFNDSAATSMSFSTARVNAHIAGHVTALDLGPGRVRGGCVRRLGQRTVL